MDIELNAHEARALGVLIEKELTTPDQYPLSLNATTNGCNQKSNRDPEVDFSEAEVTVALQGLRMKNLVGNSSPAGGRVEKYRHNAAESLRLSPKAIAVLAELLMRGPQAPGELRTRANRMCKIADLAELGQALTELQEREMAKVLPPAAGSRAERYCQLLAPGLHPDGEAASPAPDAPAPPSSAPEPQKTGLQQQIEELEDRVVRLETTVRNLAQALGEPVPEED